MGFMMNSRLKVLFAGAGEFGVPTLEALLREHDVVGVYTQPDRPAGRGRKLMPSPVGQFVVDRAPSVPLIRTADLNAESLPPADVLVVIAFGQKIAEHITRHPRYGAINLHASRLPKYRGAAPIHRAVMAGEAVTGNSIIRLAPKMDAGAVLAMSEIPIGETETTGELHDRLAHDGAPLVLRVLQELAAGTATETEQDHTLATLAKKLSREQTLLDFTRPAAELANQIRGMYPWPGCRVAIVSPEGKELKRATLVRAKAHPAIQHLPPGTITPSHHIAASDGALELLDIHPEGSRPMPFPAYLNGSPFPPGGSVRSIE
jgi:methionyl-tRNA formyltransferase